MPGDKKGREEIAGFYDDFSRRLIDDYVNGNARIEKAVDLVVRTIQDADRSLVDIGCGIGYSTLQYVRNHPHLRATGVDISPVNIKVASTLFPSKQTDYVVSNLADGVVKEKFDVVALLDMYEHVPRQDWPSFNSTLAGLLNDRGRIVLTTPSPLHQTYLTEHRPEALQVVDETVQIEDVLQLARDTTTTIVLYELISVYRTHDYLHLVLDRNPSFERPPQRSLLERFAAKAKKVASELPMGTRFRKRRQISYNLSFLNNRDE